MAYIGKSFLAMLLTIACVSYISCSEVKRDLQFSEWDRDDDDDNWWKRITTDPFDDRDTIRPSSNFDKTLLILYIVAIIATIIAVCGLVYCFRFVCENGRSTAVSSSTSSTVIIPPPENTTPAFQVDSPLASAAPFFNIFRGDNGDPPVSNNSSDKPPSYDDVALNDLKAKENKYPEVKPSVSENSPPKYDEKFALKY